MELAVEADGGKKGKKKVAEMEGEPDVKETADLNRCLDRLSLTLKTKIWNVRKKTKKERSP